MSIDELVQFLANSECWQQFSLFHKLNQHLWHNQYTQHASTEQHVIGHMQYQQGIVHGAVNTVQAGVTSLLLLGLITVVCDHTTAQDDT